MLQDSAFQVAARQRVAMTADAVRTVGGVFDAETERILDVLFACQGKVFVTGSGTSGAMARRMAHLFAVSGTPSMFIQPSDALHGTMGALSSGDVLIAISKGGSSAEINDLCRRAQQRGVTVVALTFRADGELASIADYVQIFPSVDGLDPGDMIAMGTTLMHAVWGDCLAVELMYRRQYRWSEVAFTHPLGAVGKLDTLPPDEPAGATRER